MTPQQLNYKSYDQMLDAFNEREDKQLSFADWFQHRLSVQPSIECDHPDMPAVWIDQDDDDDSLSAVCAPKKPVNPNGGGFLFEHAVMPENEDDPQQLVHV